MSNVDLIIKYLSKEMNPEESGSLEHMLESDSEFREEFEEVSAAYNLVRDELRKKDEAEFRSKLQEAMDKPQSNMRNNFRRRRRLYLLLPLAGSLAILLAIFLSHRGSDRLLSQFFNPGHDPVLLAFNQETRGIKDSGASLFHRGFIRDSRIIAEAALEADSENRLALLYYLLTSIELDLEEDALRIIESMDITTDHQLGQSIVWYRSLALLKAGRNEEAVSELGVLEQQPGPYETDARRLKKMLLK